MSDLEVDLQIYSFRPFKSIVEITSPANFSGDERYLAGTWLTHKVDLDAPTIGVVDLKTGKKTPLRDADNCVEVFFMTGTNNLIWTDDYKGVMTAEVVDSKGRTTLTNKRVISSVYAKLYYEIPGKGLYFESEKEAFISPDLKSVHPTKLVTNRYHFDRWFKGREQTDPRLDWDYSPDNKLVAYTIDMGKKQLPLIKVFDKSGKSRPIARGMCPVWKGGHPWN